MEKLVQGVHQFQSTIFRENKEFFSRLTGAQNPQALFITCSDSRVVPDLITQAAPGDLFTLRNVGNIIPPYGQGSGAEAAVIEYAIKALNVNDIIICGHTNCGAMQGLLNPDILEKLPQTKKWLRHADSSKEVVDAAYSHIEGDSRWKVLCEENVLVQLENLRTHPSVAVGLSLGELKLHAWVYKMETGQVFSFDPATGQFELLEQSVNGPDGHTKPLLPNTNVVHHSHLEQPAEQP